MIKKLLLFALLLSFSVKAQHTIKGTLKPAHNYSWAILYKLNAAEQVYIKNTKVKDGKFSFKLPKKAKTGVYRILYDLNNNGFVDVIFNNQNIAFTFNPENPYEDINFTSSNENKLYLDFTKKMVKPQQKLDSLQLAYIGADKIAKNKISFQYKKALLKFNQMQGRFEKQSDGMLAHHFIVADKRFNSPTLFDSTALFLNSIKKHYFDNIDFKDSILLNSSFIVDRINEYLFYLNVSPDRKTQNKLYKDAIDAIVYKISNQKTKKEIVKSIIDLFLKKDNGIIVDYAMDNYFLNYPQNATDEAFQRKVNGKMKTAVGNTAPEITWTENGKEKKLSDLNNAKNYVVVFWSSTCSHCLHQLPIFYNYLKDKKDIQVVAIGLENNDVNWKKVIPRFDGESWINILGLNKWQNKFAKLYNIHATPTFLILNANKKIISKPEDVEDLEAFFNHQKS